MEPDIARAEYETNGQEGLDQLLAALDGGFEGVGTALLEEPSALTKVVLARRSDVKFTGSLDPLSLLHALQATFLPPLRQTSLDSMLCCLQECQPTLLSSKAKLTCMLKRFTSASCSSIQQDKNAEDCCHY